MIIWNSDLSSIKFKKKDFATLIETVGERVTSKVSLNSFMSKWVINDWQLDELIQWKSLSIKLWRVEVIQTGHQYTQIDTKNRSFDVQWDTVNLNDGLIDFCKFLRTHENQENVQISQWILSEIE